MASTKDKTNRNKYYFDQRLGLKIIMDPDWQKLNTSTSEVSPSYSSLLTGGPPLTPEQERERQRAMDECTTYFDEETNNFVPYPPYLRSIYDWLQKKGWISSPMDFAEFRYEWHIYIRKSKNKQYK